MGSTSLCHVILCCVTTSHILRVPKNAKHNNERVFVCSLLQLKDLDQFLALWLLVRNNQEKKNSTDGFHEKEIGAGAVKEADEALLFQEIKIGFCLFVLLRRKLSLNFLLK